MRLILHIGLHRAASTSLQQVLMAQAAVLRNEGIVTVTQQMTGTAGYRVFKDLRGHAVARHGVRQTADRLNDWLADNAGDARCLVYSSENMPGLMPGKRHTAFAHVAELAALIGELRKSHDVEVVTVLREHVGYLRSLYNVRRMRTHIGRFGDFADTLDLHSVRFADMLETLGRAAGRGHMHVFDFEEVRQGRGHVLVAGLARLVQARSLDGVALPAHNRSMSARQAAIFDALNAAGIFIAFGRDRDRLLQAITRIDDLASPASLAVLHQAVHAGALRLPFAIRSERHLRLVARLQSSRLVARALPVRERDLAPVLATAARTLARPDPDLRVTQALWQYFSADRARIARDWLAAWADLPPPA